MTPVWIAYASGNRRAAHQNNPRQAAAAFFKAYPTARKCDIAEHRLDERGRVTRIYDLTGHKAPLRDYVAITPAKIDGLPEE